MLHKHEKQILLMQGQIDELRHNLDSEKESREKLEHDFHSYTSTDNRAMVTAINDSTNAIRDNTAILNQVKGKL